MAKAGQAQAGDEKPKASASKKKTGSKKKTEDMAAGKSSPLESGKLSVDVDAFIAEAADAKLSFLCTPNNPTGTVTGTADIERILSEISGVLFLDNAYVEFCDVDYLPLLKKYDNLVIGRTLSKVYGLAGLRVGYGFVPAWLEGPYRSAATPFTLNRVSEACASFPGLGETFVRVSVGDVWENERFLAAVKQL